MIGETISGKCDNDCMEKQTRRPKTTEWNLGQPLAFPPKLKPAEFERLAREVVDEAMSGPFKHRRPKHKKR